MYVRGYRLCLFGGFELRLGSRVLDVPHSAQRLLGFLALHDRPLPRSYVADTLWPDACEAKAHANLRTALWRLDPGHHSILDITPVELALSPAVRVDARMVHQAARDFRRCGALPAPESLLDIHGELMPGCWDCWLVFERERLRHEVVELLQAAGQQCLAREDFHLATILGLSAIECDPLRDSTNLLVVRVRLAAGDRGGAIRYALQYTRLLRDELQLPPPPEIAELLPARPPVGRRDIAERLRPAREVSLACPTTTHR